jgi:predicted CoA-binding protein
MSTSKRNKNLEQQALKLTKLFDKVSQQYDEAVKEGRIVEQFRIYRKGLSVERKLRLIWAQLGIRSENVKEKVADGNPELVN